MSVCVCVCVTFFPYHLVLDSRSWINYVRPPSLTGGKNKSEELRRAVQMGHDVEAAAVGAQKVANLESTPSE